MKEIKDVRAKYEGMFKQPDDGPWFPDDITQTTEDDLGRLLTLYTKWKNYVSEQVSIDDAELTALKEEIELDKAKELVNLAEDDLLKSRFSAKEDRLAYVITRGHISVKLREAAQLNAVVKIEKAVLDNMESRYGCISREVTRRQRY